MKYIFAAGFLMTSAVSGSAQDLPTSQIPNLIAADTSDAAQTKRVSVVVDRGLTSHKQLRSRSARRAREVLHKGGELTADELRMLAGAGDGLAAQRYVRVLQAAETPANPSDIAYFAAIAVGTGRIWTLGTMVEAMHALDPETEPRERIRKYIRVLYPHAWAGNSVAFDAVVAFNGEGKLFGPLSKRTRDRILNEAREQGDGRIELGMAMGLLESADKTDPPAQDTLAQARALLEQVSSSEHLAVATTAQNLLRLMDTQQQARDG